MVAMFITIDILEIGHHKLNLNEYLTLMKFKHDLEKRSFPFIPDERFYERLLKDEFIGVNIDLETGKVSYTLKEKGLKVFDDGDDLFEEFYELFPNAVDTEMGKRVISAKDPNSISGRNTKTIWKRITKGKLELQKKIIKCLKRELDNRKSNNSMAYLQGIDTWLRQATWEKWENIPDKKSSSNYIKL